MITIRSSSDTLFSARYSSKMNPSKTPPNSFAPMTSDKDDMYSYLGHSGMRVSKLGFGTMTFGTSKAGRPGQVTDDVTCGQLLDRYLELGGNLIDTSNAYGGGEAEELIGRWLTRQERSKVVLASKLRFMTDKENPNSVGLSRKTILWNIERSLKRLQTDHLDLYQLHLWDDGCKVEEVLRTLDDLVRAGKIRYIGASNFTGWQLQKMTDYAKFMGLNPIVSLQCQYNLVARSADYELTSVCRNEGIGMLSWSPLKGGLLTGKVTRDGVAPEESRMRFTEANPSISMESHPRLSTFQQEDRVWEILDLVRQIAKEHDKSVAQVALRWVIQKDFVSAAIMGVSSLGQLESNMAAASGWELTESQMKVLDEASNLSLVYPYSLNEQFNRFRVRSNWCK